MLSQSQAAVLIFAGKCHIPAEPVRRDEFFGLLLCLKFHFCQTEPFVDAGEEIQFDSKAGAFYGDPVTALGQDDAVGFGEKMVIGLLRQGKIVFFPFQKAFGLIGELVLLILLSDPHHRFCAQIGLLDGTGGPGSVVCRQCGHQIFAFDFHNEFSPFSWMMAV